jgi:hypothetical protein
MEYLTVWLISDKTYITLYYLHRGPKRFRKNKAKEFIKKLPMKTLRNYP